MLEAAKGFSVLGKGGKDSASARRCPPGTATCVSHLGNLRFELRGKLAVKLTARAWLLAALGDPLLVMPVGPGNDSG